MAEKVSLIRRAVRKLGPGNPLEAIDLDAVFPSQEELNEDKDDNRRMARHYAEDFEKASESNNRVMTEQSRWLGATLTTINIAGLFAPLQFKGSALLQGIALAAFVLGIIASLWGTHLGIRNGLAMSLRLGEIKGYWRAVEHNGFRDRDTELQIAQLGTEALQKAGGAYASGYISLGAFVLGAASTALAFLL